MKIVLTIFLALVFGLIICTSCEKDVDNVRYPEFNQKLIIAGFISPNNRHHYISVTSNRKIYGDLSTNETLGNLTATLSDNTREISLDTTKSGFVFRPSDLPIVEGKTYTLKVRSDKGLFAEAYCTVPLNRSFALEIDTFRRVVDDPFNNKYSSFMSNFYFTDIQGEDNYYRLYCEQISYNSSYQISPSANRFMGYENEYFNDKGRDGKRSLITTINIEETEAVDSSFLKVYLLNTDKVYFDYHKSLKNYSGGDDPFTEASPIYSNIKGGLGIFAAYTVDSLIFRLK